jgi:hypothetical protein
VRVRDQCGPRRVPNFIASCPSGLRRASWPIEGGLSVALTSRTGLGSWSVRLFCEQLSCDAQVTKCVAGLQQLLGREHKSWARSWTAFRR